MDIEHLKGKPAYFLLELANDSPLSDDANRQLRAWFETVEYQIAEIEKLRAERDNALKDWNQALSWAGQAEAQATTMRNQMTAIAAACITSKKGLKEFPDSDYERGRDQAATGPLNIARQALATDAGKAAAEMLKTAAALAKAGLLDGRPEAKAFKEAADAYRTKGQGDG